MSKTLEVEGEDYVPRRALDELNAAARAKYDNLAMEHQALRDKYDTLKPLYAEQADGLHELRDRSGTLVGSLANLLNVWQRVGEADGYIDIRLPSYAWAEVQESLTNMGDAHVE